MKHLIVIVSSILLISGCAATSDIDNENVNVTFNIRAGAGWGGIIEDTKIDAVTGATNIGFTSGVHSSINIYGHMIESGLDMQTYNQSYTYNDELESFNGKRDFSLTEISIPLTYNFQFINDADMESILHIKLGLSGSYIVSADIKDNGTPPDYSLRKFSIGPTFGISVIPFRLTDTMKLGFYFDLTRGSKIYDDFYISSDAGYMSGMKFGLLLKIK